LRNIFPGVLLEKSAKITRPPMPSAAPIRPFRLRLGQALLRSFQPNDHEDAFITPENERYYAGGGWARSIKLLQFNPETQRDP